MFHNRYTFHIKPTDKGTVILENYQGRQEVHKEADGRIVFQKPVNAYLRTAVHHAFLTLEANSFVYEE